MRGEEGGGAREGEQGRGMKKKREGVAVRMLHTMRMCALERRTIESEIRGGSRVWCAERESIMLSMMLRRCIGLLRGTGMYAG